jgi:RNA polymerase sigma factor (sigma-70 family)
LNKTEYNSAVVEHSQGLFRYAYKWLKCEADAKDLVQDVYGKLWENRTKVVPVKVKSWLFTCMHNALVNFSTRQKRFVHTDDLSKEQVRCYQPNLALQDLLEKAIEQLPDVQRSIVLLRDLEGYTYEEIGEILGLNESQVKVYLFRARQKMKEQLKDLSVLVA